MDIGKPDEIIRNGYFALRQYEAYLPTLKQKRPIHGAKPHDAIPGLEIAQPAFSSHVGTWNLRDVSSPVAALVEEVAEAFEELAGRCLDHRLLGAWLQLRPGPHCAPQVLVWHNLPGGLVVHRWLSLGWKVSVKSKDRLSAPAGCCCCCLCSC